MKSLILVALCLVWLVTPAEGRPGDRFGELRPEIPDLSTESTPPNPALSSHVFADTVGYGGTFWAPDSMRWEALRDSHWSFDSGVGSSINTGANPNKPVGYHQQMEGWYGIDQTLPSQPYFRRSSTCAIGGSFSFWAGVTLAEANGLCYATGQGYGNDWSIFLARSFSYAGSGSVAFSFDYALDAEPGFDYAYARVDTTGDGSAPDLVLWTGTGVAAAHLAFTLDPGQEMRSSPGNVIIRFVAQSDGGYSDQDGSYPTTCGLLAVDNVQFGASLST
ncbi:MAG TPA: hypothetical protein VF720_04610, partial [Candidatus Eisenbacteria bacterium]